ncbi:hypothetical protein X736_33740 [Mesorhizobium sp. L2C089B000]|nr:hypothetical protein X736_33740 [Mesorhizobium sp. L2C089B000]
MIESVAVEPGIAPVHSGPDQPAAGSVGQDSGFAINRGAIRSHMALVGGNSPPSDQPPLLDLIIQ